VIAGRQEWITAIECVSAAGTAIPPLIIFKAQHTNTAWIFVSKVTLRDGSYGHRE
jgi:hypothetical protein